MRSSTGGTVITAVPSLGTCSLGAHSRSRSSLCLPSTPQTPATRFRQSDQAALLPCCLAGPFLDYQRHAEAGVGAPRYGGEQVAREHHWRSRWSTRLLGNLKGENNSGWVPEAYLPSSSMPRCHSHLLREHVGVQQLQESFFTLYHVSHCTVSWAYDCCSEILYNNVLHALSSEVIFYI